MTQTATTRIVVFDNPDFGASRRMVDTVRDLADERPDIAVEQIDIWQHPDQGVAHDVMTVPTTIIFVGDSEQKRLCGLRSARALRRAVARATDREPTSAQRLDLRTAAAG